MPARAFASACGYSVTPTTSVLSGTVLLLLLLLLQLLQLLLLLAHAERAMLPGVALLLLPAHAAARLLHFVRPDDEQRTRGLLGLARCRRQPCASAPLSCVDQRKSDAAGLRALLSADQASTEQAAGGRHYARPRARLSDFSLLLN